MHKVLAFPLLNIFAFIISYCIGFALQTIWDDVTWIIQGGDLSSMINPSGAVVAALVILVFLFFGFQAILFSEANIRNYLYLFAFYILVYFVDLIFLFSPLVCQGELCGLGVLFYYLPISATVIFIFNAIITFVLTKRGII